MINELFNKLDDWRHLPNYQLERRTDIFFAIHLKELFKKIKNVNIIETIPELPIRIGSIYPDIPINKSYKVDYASFSDTNEVYIIELKTDNGSIRDSQYKYYCESIKVGVPKIIEGILEIIKSTNNNYEQKYNYLLDKLKKLKAVELDKPSSKYKFYPTSIFIKPTKKIKDTGEIIEFDMIIDCLKNNDSEFTQRFIKSLKTWKQQA